MFSSTCFLFLNSDFYALVLSPQHISFFLVYVLPLSYNKEHIKDLLNARRLKSKSIINVHRHGTHPGRLRLPRTLVFERFRNAARCTPLVFNERIHQGRLLSSGAAHFPLVVTRIYFEERQRRACTTRSTSYIHIHTAYISPTVIFPFSGAKLHGVYTIGIPLYVRN